MSRRTFRRLTRILFPIIITVIAAIDRAHERRR